MQRFQQRFTPQGQPPLEGVPAWLSPVLQGRGIRSGEEAERFLHPSLDQLHVPGRMQDMEQAVNIIRKAIAGGERILVYGDYDVDGVCATTILLETLREIGANADFRIPSRHSEGYGLNLAAVEEIAKDYSLLITVDCGISSAREVKRAREKGLRVIVTDHHELPETLPQADAVLDPLLGDYPFRRLCGAGVALKLSQALAGPEKEKEVLDARLEIAALATVADIVPLTDENRVIVWEGMRRMAESRRPGLRALMENAGVHPPVRSEDLAFRLGPRLNAAGRLEDAAQGVHLLMTRDAAEAKAIADHLEENNRRRQEMEQAILQEAKALLPAQADLSTDRAIVLAGEGWNTGLIGLAAGKLCEKTHHPTVVLSLQGDTAVGSCRSIPGINIYRALQQCGDLLLRYGGHEQAAGLTVAAENIPALRRRLNGAIRAMCGECGDEVFIPVTEYDGELPLGEVTLETVRALEQLEPTGYGNPAPVFRAPRAQVLEMRRVGRDRSHLRLTLAEGGRSIGGIGFGLGDEADRGYAAADVLFCPTRNEYNGIVSAQLQVKAILPAREEGAPGAGKLPERDRRAAEQELFFLSCLQEMSRLAAKNAQYGSPAEGLRPEHLLKERVREIDLTDDELRGIYRWLRDHRAEAFASAAEMAAAAGTIPAGEGTVPLTRDRLMTALTAFAETGLLTWRPRPFRVELNPRPARCAMTDSHLIRYLRQLHAASLSAEA